MLPGLLRLRMGAVGSGQLRATVRCSALGRSFPLCASSRSGSSPAGAASPGLHSDSQICTGLLVRLCTQPVHVAAAAGGSAGRPRDMATRVRAESGGGSAGNPPSKKQKGKQGGGGGGAAAAAQAAQVAAAQQPQPRPPAGQPPPPPASPAVRYSPLHYNVEEFCLKVVPTEGERKQRQEVVEAVRAGVRRVWPGSRSVQLEVFGSFANGLSTWNSDLDLVVTGVAEPDRLSGGYEPTERGRITSKLRKIADAISRGREVEVLRQQLIPRARIPLLKLWTRSRVCVDVSLGDDSGPRAARYMAQQARAYPPLKPLVLVLKAYLKACRLNEVNTGGLSSYSLTNMVIAHLQEELKSGHDVSDLGETLYTFMLRYGEEHDYSSQAVSVASGGIVPKSSLGVAMESARLAALSMGSYDNAVSWNERLCVDCPLTGRDVSNGTYRIDLVRSAFHDAARKLEALAQGRRISDTNINYLQALFDVQRVLRRSYPDPSEGYQDEYLKVIGGRSGGSEEEEEELPMGGASGGEDEGEEDGGGDYMERPTGGGGGGRQHAAAAARQQGGRR